MQLIKNLSSLILPVYTLSTAYGYLNDVEVNTTTPNTLHLKQTHATDHAYTAHLQLSLDTLLHTNQITEIIGKPLGTSTCIDNVVFKSGGYMGNDIGDTLYITTSGQGIVILSKNMLDMLLDLAYIKSIADRSLHIECLPTMLKPALHELSIAY